MLNIYYKGFFKEEGQLKCASIKNECTRFEEPEDIDTLMKEGLFISLPIIFASLIISARTICTVMSDKMCGKNDLIISFIISSIILVFELIVHEIIHALLYPNKAVKEIYVTANLSSLFVYCTEPVSKTRFIIITIAPNIVLGMILIALAVVFKNLMMNPAMVFVLSFTGFFSIITGVGDYYNIYNAIYQVPCGAYVFNSGLHSYWYECRIKERKKSAGSTQALLVLLFSMGFIFLSLKIEVCILLFFINVMITALNRGSFCSVFKWLNLIAIGFAYLIL